MANLNKRKDVLTEMQHAVKRLEVAVFTKVMVRKSTTKGVTEGVVYEMSRLGLLVVQQIVHVSLKGHN
jgi:hypothetical protein